MSKATNIAKQLKLQNAKQERSQTKRAWQELDAHLAHMDAASLRAFYAAAAKFLIPAHQWSASHPACRFDDIDLIQAFHAGFDSWEPSLFPNPALQSTFRRLKSAANYTHPGIKFKAAAKRLSSLRLKMNSRLKKFAPDEQRPNRGTRYYQGLLKKVYWKGMSASSHTGILR